MTPSNTYDYSKEETNITHRRRASAIRGRIQTWIQPQISCALPCNTSQERETIQRAGRIKTGCVDTLSLQLDKEICQRWHKWIKDKSRTRPQTDNGLFGRGIGPGCRVTGTTERKVSQGTMGERFREDCERHYLQTFFRSSGARYKRIPKRPRVPPLAATLCD